jgi:hypothetical protein
MAFNQSNISSGWAKTGLWPFDPSQVLSQLATQQNHPETRSASRPATSSSGGRSAISEKDWQRLNQAMRTCVGEAVRGESLRVLKTCHQLYAQNALLKAENQGLRDAVRISKKAKKPGKTIFSELRGEEASSAIFFSPRKIQEARDLHTQEEEQENKLKAQKQLKKLQQQQRKKEQEELKRERAAARKERRAKKAQEKAEKDAERQEATLQRLASLQLSNEQKSATPKQKKRPRNSKQRRSLDEMIVRHSDDGIDFGMLSRTSRSGRALKPSQRIKDGM